MESRRSFLKGLAAVMAAPFTAVVVPEDVYAPTVSIFGRMGPPSEGLEGPVALTEGDHYVDLRTGQYYRFTGKEWEKTDESAVA